jgi:hypothetical protein
MHHHQCLFVFGSQDIERESEIWRRRRKTNFLLLFAFLVSGWLMLGVGFRLAGRA